MLGVFFTEFLDRLEGRHGLHVVDAVIAGAELPNGGAYTAAGNYDWREFERVDAGAARALDTTSDAVLFAHGRHMFGVFASRYPELVQRQAAPAALLAAIGPGVEAVVRAVHPAVAPPRLAVTSAGDGFAVHCACRREFVAMAHGFLVGCLDHCGAAAVLVPEPSADGVVFRCAPVEVLCPTS